MQGDAAFLVAGLVLATPPAALAILELTKRCSQAAKQRKQGKQPSEVTESATAPRFKLGAIQRPEPNDKLLSKLNNLMMVISVIPLMIFDASFVYYAAAKGFESKLDAASALFLVMVFGLPALVIFDVFVSQPRKRKRGTSSVAEQATLQLEGDADALLDVCQQALTEMGGRLFHLDRERRLIKADFGKDTMTVKIRRTRSSKSRILVVSDSKWISVVIDGGRNRLRMDTFIKKISGGGN